MKSALGGDFQALAKFLTWIERSSATDVLALPLMLEPTKLAFRVGITGPPGAGKSTLVGGLLKLLRAQNLKVGVLAVDPSSPFSKGAVLGDRIRYSEHFLDGGVFIRSLGTRGSLGGLSSAAFLMARAFDVCSFDVLLIETVGVGQTELDVLHVADEVCVVLVPESGDSIQAMKAGLMEIADLFIINKSDRPGAEGLAREIAATGDAEVIQTIASQGDGLQAFAEHILTQRTKAEWVKNRAGVKRLREEAKALLRREWENAIDEIVSQIGKAEDLGRMLSQNKAPAP